MLGERVFTLAEKLMFATFAELSVAPWLGGVKLYPELLGVTV